MKSKEEIVNDSIKLDTPPNSYNLIEIYCFLSLKQLSAMFFNNQISKANATKTKQLILADYENNVKKYEFEKQMFLEHINNIKDTEKSRIKLHKILNNESTVTEERICEAFNVCMDIISKTYKGEF